MRAGLWYNFPSTPSLSALSEGNSQNAEFPGLEPQDVSIQPQRANRDGFLRQDTRGQWYADYKCHEELRRLLTPNGKMYGRKRLNLTASEQRKVAQAIKRARHMALLPFTSATL